MKQQFDDLSAICSRVTTRYYSTSFSLGISFLSKHLRQPIYDIYGFVRLADEIVDSFHNYDKTYLLNKFKHDCNEAISMGISLNPILNSFQRTINQYGVDQEFISLFMDSMEIDLQKKQYNPESYDQYILGSAQVVGLMCLYVFVEGDTDRYNELKSSAMKLGSAFQKVNFLRDLNADYLQLGRTYFPGIKIDDFTDEDKRQIEMEIESEFKETLRGIKGLPLSARKGVYLAYVYYYQLFRKLKRIKPERLISERVRISNTRKCILMVDTMIRHKLNAI